MQSSCKGWHNPLLKEFCLERPNFPKDVVIKDVQLHGFCDASAVAYSGVVYLRAADDQNNVPVALVMAKTKVSPINR